MDSPVPYRTERNVFGGTGLFLVPWAILYGATSDDRAGMVLLAGCAVALLVLAGYFEFISRQAQRSEAVLHTERADALAPAAAPAAVAAHHAPAMSVWPLVIAGGATLLGFGLAFTVWVAIPAGMLIAAGVLGYARET